LADCSCSVSFDDGEGPGVNVSGADVCVGADEAVGLMTHPNPVLLFPLICFDRGLEGKPIPANGFFGGGVGTGSSLGVGVGGNVFITGTGGKLFGRLSSLLRDFLSVSVECTDASAILASNADLTLAILLSLRGWSRVGICERGTGIGPPFPPLGPFLRSSSDVNLVSGFLFKGATTGRALLFSGGGGGEPDPGTRSEDAWFPMRVCC
jgi:hypothetical protein